MQKLWGLLFGVVLAAAFVLTVVSSQVGWWLPHPASSYAADIDNLFSLILWVVAFFFVLTEAVLVYAMIRFAQAPGRKAEYTHGNHRLELFWTFVPGVILIMLALFQIKVWASIKYPTHMAEAIETEDFLQLDVTMRQWEYRVRYPSPERYAGWFTNRDSARDDYAKKFPERPDDIPVVNDIHCVKGQKVLMHLRTRDVIHAVFLPQIRLKQDALPGRTIPSWFEATEANYRLENGQWVEDRNRVFDLVCTQYCGSRHSMMRGKLYVHPTKDDFVAWLKSAADEYRKGTPAEKVADAR